MALVDIAADTQAISNNKWKIFLLQTAFCVSYGSKDCEDSNKKQFFSLTKTKTTTNVKNIVWYGFADAMLFFILFYFIKNNIKKGVRAPSQWK